MTARPTNREATDDLLIKSSLSGTLEEKLESILRQIDNLDKRTSRIADDLEALDMRLAFQFALYKPAESVKG